MYIEKVEIENFRIFGNKVEILFQKGLNMLIGENSSGKTAIIDAIRLVLSIGTYKRNFYMDENDFHINEYGERMLSSNISIYFDDLNDTQKSELMYLININDQNSNKAEIHVNFSGYYNSKGNFRVREDVTGFNEQMIPDTDKACLQKLTYIFMPALRDAENDMKPSKYSQLSKLLLKYANTDEKKEKLIEIIKVMNKSILKNETIFNIKDTINKRLRSMEKEILIQEIDIDISELNINDIGAILRIANTKKLNKIIITEEDKNKLEEKMDISKYIELNEDKFILKINEMKKDGIGVDDLDIKDFLENKNNVNFLIKQNGLGYNNILSMATELSNFKETDKDDFLVMLIEEPEAHLHPQLLYLLDDFLKEDENNQIILTSHSPTLISRFKLDKLIILQKDNENIKVANLSKINFEKGEQEILERYLDVTKSQMFFSKGIIFVEGVTEALLVNEFSKKIGKDLDKYSVEIVNMNGVDFEPFAKLFQIENNKNLLSIKCSIITDDDRCINKDDDNSVNAEEIKSFTKINESAFEEISNKIKNGNISYRAQKLKTYNKNNIKVVLAKKTFEYELAMISENREILMSILKDVHLQIYNSIKDEYSKYSDELFATKFWIAIKDSKYEFSCKLLEEIISGKSFTIPNYIIEAINYVTE